MSETPASERAALQAFVETTLAEARTVFAGLYATVTADDRLLIDAGLSISARYRFRQAIGETISAEAAAHLAAQEANLAAIASALTANALNGLFNTVLNISANLIAGVVNANE